MSYAVSAAVTGPSRRVTFRRGMAHCAHGVTCGGRSCLRTSCAALLRPAGRRGAARRCAVAAGRPGRRGSSVAALARRCASWPPVSQRARGCRRSVGPGPATRAPRRGSATAPSARSVWRSTATWTRRRGAGGGTAAGVSAGAGAGAGAGGGVGVGAGLGRASATARGQASAWAPARPGAGRRGAGEPDHRLVRAGAGCGTTGAGCVHDDARELGGRRRCNEDDRLRRVGHGRVVPGSDGAGATSTTAGAWWPRAAEGRPAGPEVSRWPGRTSRPATTEQASAPAAICAQAPLMFSPVPADNDSEGEYRQRGADDLRTNGKLQAQTRDVVCAVGARCRSRWRSTATTRSTRRSETRRVDAGIEAGLRGALAAYAARLDGATAAGATARGRPGAAAGAAPPRRAALATARGSGHPRRTASASARRRARRRVGRRRAEPCSARSSVPRPDRRPARARARRRAARLGDPRRRAAPAGSSRDRQRRRGSRRTGPRRPAVRVGGTRYRGSADGAARASRGLVFAVLAPQSAIDAASRSSEARLFAGLLASLILFGVVTYLLGRSIVGTLAPARRRRQRDRPRPPRRARRGARRDEFAQLGTRVQRHGRPARGAARRARDRARTHARRDRAVRRGARGDARRRPAPARHRRVRGRGDRRHGRRRARPARRARRGPAIPTRARSGSRSRSGSGRPTSASSCLASRLVRRRAVGDGRVARRPGRGRARERPAPPARQPQALVDSLTGLANRRSVEDTLAPSSRAPRASAARSASCSPTSTASSTSTTASGHPSATRSCGSSRDVAARVRARERRRRRWGGEEFALVLPGTGPEGGARLAERARTALEAVHVAAPDGDDGRGHGQLRRRRLSGNCRARRAARGRRLGALRGQAGGQEPGRRGSSAVGCLEDRLNCRGGEKWRQSRRIHGRGHAVDVRTGDPGPSGVEGAQRGARARDAARASTWTDDPFENHPLFKTEEQARIEETMDGVAGIEAEETSLDWPTTEDTFIDEPGPSPDADATVPRRTATGRPERRRALRREPLVPLPRLRLGRLRPRTSRRIEPGLRAKVHEITAGKSRPEVVEDVLHRPERRRPAEVERARGEDLGAAHVS